MSNLWLQAPYLIHVGVSNDLARRYERDARAEGATVISLDLRDVTDSDTLGLRIADVFHFPLRTTSLDSAVDWMADLEWLGETPGYLIEVTSLDTLRPSVVRDFAQILPSVVDRCRSGAMPYVVVLVGDRHAQHALEALEDSNLRLAGHRELPWSRPDTGPVLVEDHRAD